MFGWYFAPWIRIQEAKILRIRILSTGYICESIVYIDESIIYFYVFIVYINESIMYS